MWSLITLIILCLKITVLNQLKEVHFTDYLSFDWNLSFQVYKSLINLTSLWYSCSAFGIKCSNPYLKRCLFNRVQLLGSWGRDIHGHQCLVQQLHQWCLNHFHTLCVFSNLKLEVLVQYFHCCLCLLSLFDLSHKGSLLAFRNVLLMKICGLLMEWNLLKNHWVLSFIAVERWFWISQALNEFYLEILLILRWKIWKLEEVMHFLLIQEWLSIL